MTCQPSHDRLDNLVDLLDISWSSEHAELTSTSSPSDLLASDSSVLKEGGGLNNSDRALSSLAVLREAPAVDLTISGDSEGVVGAGSNERCGDS